MRRLWLLMVGGAVAVGGAAGAGMPDDLAVGTRVEVEGRLSAGTVRAVEVEVKRASGGTDELEGRIDSAEPGSRRLQVAGVGVALEPGALLTDADGLAVDPGKVQAGSKADLKGRFEGGVFHASELELKELDLDEEDEVELEGTISEVDPASSSFRVLGISVRVEPATKVEID